jgi:hypothetical protein
VADYAWSSDWFPVEWLEDFNSVTSTQTVYPDGSTSKWFARCSWAVDDLNHRYFNFAIDYLAEGMTVFCAHAESESDWNIAKTVSAIPRKLVLLVQLHNGKDEEACHLQLRFGDEIVNLESGPGNVYLIPSYVPFKICNPTTETARYAIVMVNGPDFK